MKPSFGNPKLEKFLFCDLRDKKNKFNGEIQKIRHYRYHSFFFGGGGRQNLVLAQVRRRSRAGPGARTKGENGYELH
jgi:hypothetical protein